MNTSHKKLERLMLFHEVAKHLSFTEAADALGISKSHLSLQIKRLEKEMNVPLFVRSTRSVKLTEQGRVIASRTQKIHSSLLDIERSVMVEHEEISGVIKLTAPLLFTDAVLLPLCEKFKSLYPQISFTIDCSYTPYDLNKSDFDLAFRATQSPPQNMVAKEILPYQSMCYASPEYLKVYGEPQTIESLTAHQCLSSHDVPRWEFRTGVVEVEGWLKLNDSALLKSQALMGKGIIRVPDYYAKKEVALGELLPLLQHQSSQDRAIYLIYPQVIFQSKKIKAFIEFAFDELKKQI